MAELSVVFIFVTDVTMKFAFVSLTSQRSISVVGGLSLRFHCPPELLHNNERLHSTSSFYGDSQQPQRNKLYFHTTVKPPNITFFLCSVLHAGVIVLVPLVPIAVTQTLKSSFLLGGKTAAVCARQLGYCCQTREL